jgi:hypothetical protein
MSPEQIDLVVTTWRDARRDSRVNSIIAESLPGTHDERTARAAWIVDTVTVLSAVLNQPGQFNELSERVLSRRVGVTIAELTVDREALLIAIRLQQPDDETARERIDRAWSLAIQLFGEIVTAACLDPFSRLVAPPGRDLVASQQQSPVRIDPR